MQRAIASFVPTAPRRAFPAWTHLTTGVVLPASPLAPGVRDRVATKQVLMLRPVFIRSEAGRNSFHANGGR